MGCVQLAGHPVYLLGQRWEGMKAMVGAVPEMPALMAQIPQQKHICDYKTCKLHEGLQP